MIIKRIGAAGAIWALLLCAAAAQSESTGTTVDYCVDSPRAVQGVLESEKISESIERRLAENARALQTEDRNIRTRLNELAQIGAIGGGLTSKNVAEVETLTTRLEEIATEMRNLQANHVNLYNFEIFKIEHAVVFELDLMSKERNAIIQFACNFSSPNKQELTDEIITRAAARLKHCRFTSQTMDNVSCEDQS